MYFRIFLLYALELMISAYISVASFESLRDEYRRKTADGLSQTLATLMLLIFVPVICHMIYIMTAYNDYLEEPDIKERYG